MNQYDDKVWDAVKIMWMAGNSAYSIAGKQGMPTRTAICERVKQESWERLNEPDDALDLIQFDGLSPEQQIVIREVARGLPQRWAAAKAGVTEHSVSAWKREKPQFLQALQAAVAVFAGRQIDKVTVSEDWRSGLEMLKLHPELRKEFAPPVQAPSPLVSLNVLGAVQVGVDRTPQIEQPQGLLESA